MNPDALKAAWQSQMSHRRLMIDADVLLEEVRHNERSFRQTILWRDVREVGLLVLVAVFLLWCGINYKARAWSLFVLAALLAGVAVVMVVDRLRQRKRRSAYSDPLLACAEESLAQINHQMWLLKNIFWWYLLPAGIGLVFFLGQEAWSLLETGSWKLNNLGGPLLVVLVFWGFYLLNQDYVRKDLEPRRRELEALLQSLKDAVR